ncbi:MAG: hypothetical protein QHJ73_10335, partial [Armatimonadota bacterium]|nr:hypothetical protein [Armatimonadota bacterium]
VGFKEDAEHRDVSGLTVSVVPAVVFFLPSGKGRASALQVGTSEAPPFSQLMKGHLDGGDWKEGQQVRVLAAGSAGRYVEHPTGSAANRLSLAAAVEARLVQAGRVPVTACEPAADAVRPAAPTRPRLELTGAIRGHTGFYSGGADYRVVTPELSLTWRNCPGGTLRLVGQYHAISGATPFFFDRVDTRSSLTAGWRHRNERRVLGAEVEWDLYAGGVYAWEVSYARRMHCLQPGLVLKRRGNDFGAGITLEIPGVGGG